jgi:predicted ABC-type transport system involved in lysophospholipase L1 biosynthesis ATPase subunit
MGLEQHSQFIEQRLSGGVQDRVNLVRWRNGSSKFLFPAGQFDDNPSSGGSKPMSRSCSSLLCALPCAVESGPKGRRIHNDG